MSSTALQKFVTPEYDEKKLALFIQRVAITCIIAIFAYLFSDTVKKSFGIGPALVHLKNDDLAHQLNALTYEFRFIVGRLMSQSEKAEKELAELREEVAELRDELETVIENLQANRLYPIVRKRPAD